MSTAACRVSPSAAGTAQPSVPALVLRPLPMCVSLKRCEQRTQFTVLLLNANGFTAAESVLVSLEPRPRRRGWPRTFDGADERRVLRALFRDLGTADRVGAGFDAVPAGEYDVRVQRLGLEAALWRVVLVPACWSRLEVLVAPSAPPNAVAPASATLYSCTDGSLPAAPRDE